MQTKEEIVDSISDSRYSIAMPFTRDMLLEAMELYASQRVGMEWVKGSEERPENSGLVHIRYKLGFNKTWSKTTGYWVPSDYSL